LEQGTVFQAIEGGGGTPTNIPGGGEPWSSWTNWNVQMPTLLCPSDGNGYKSTRGNHNYAFCIGDKVANNLWTNSNHRGIFTYQITVPISAIGDGTSNTIAMSERLRANFGVRSANGELAGTCTVMSVSNIVTNPGTCLTRQFGKTMVAGTQIKGRFGCYWTDGQTEIVAFNTVLPPNSPSCIADGDTNADGAQGVHSASSVHPGGVNILMADGSCRFMNQNIDTGNLGVQSPVAGKSPYGVWGALGTRDGREAVNDAG